MNMAWIQEDISLAEQLENIMNRKRSPLFPAEARDDANNYALGIMLLANMGVRAELSPKGPFAKHFLIWERGGDGPKDIAAFCKDCFDIADVPLRVFFCGLWNGIPRSTLSKYADGLIKREAALSKNRKFVDELDKLKAELKALKSK